MRRALVAASLAGLVFGVFCTTKDVDYDPADLEETTDGAAVGGATSSSTASSTDGSNTPTCDDGTVCSPRTVDDALILDFDGTTGAAGATNGGGLDTFGDPSGFSGGTFRYPDAFASTVEDDAWHLEGSVGQGSGFGLYLTCESDASAYSGIEFTLRGDAGPGQINMLIETSSNIPDACVGGTCTGGCAGAGVAINHTPGEETTYTFQWDDFQGGSPDDSPDPSEITAIRWEFQGQGAFPVDFYVDDIRFVE